MDEAGGRMIDHVPLRPREDKITPWQSLKFVGALLLLFGPGLPLTIFLWRLAVGG